MKTYVLRFFPMFCILLLVACFLPTRGSAAESVIKLKYGTFFP